MTLHSLRRSLIVVFLSAIALYAWAQEPTAQIVYAEDELSLQIFDTSGTRRSANIGDNIRSGETLRTGSGAAELRLNPNGTIIKLARNTSFKVEALDGLNGRSSNDFQLISGKLRAVAARSTGRENYRIRTRSAVAGVRGTDFSLEVVEGRSDILYVQSGKVEFSRMSEGIETGRIMVGAGQFADALAADFQVLPASADIINRFQDMEFVNLNPASVDQSAPIIEDDPIESAAEELPSTDSEDEETSEEAGPQATPRSDGVSAADIVTPADLDTADRSDRRARSGASESKFMSWMSDVMGFEVGAVSINEQTWAKAVIQPTFRLGKAKISLYLPIIYSNNLFDPSSWYHPAGNNEWSFGFDYWSSDPLTGAIDFARDLALKIRYIEYGNRWVDPFYFNIGNLSTMTIGHGSIMRNFANDADFPAIRRVGLNTGFDMDSWGMEFVANDLAQPDIFGTRFSFAHIAGISAIADINPARELEDSQRDAVGNPIFIAAGLDLGYSIVKTEALHIRAFTDFAFMLPYTRTAITGVAEPGFQWSAIYDNSGSSFTDRLSNYGISAGALGNVLFMDWRLEYRLFRGTFRPAFFDSSYERLRGQYAIANAANLMMGSSNAITVNGVYGEAGFTLLKDKLRMTAGYMLPWTFDSRVDLEEVFMNDYLLARLIIEKGLIPKFDIHGSISYARTGFAGALMSDGAGISLFDANTVFSGEVIYPVTPGMDLAIIVSTAAVRDAEGNFVMDETLLRPKMKPTVTFETRISF